MSNYFKNIFIDFFYNKFLKYGWQTTYQSQQKKSSNGEKKSLHFVFVCCCNVLFCFVLFFPRMFLITTLCLILPGFAMAPHIFSLKKKKLQ